MSDKKQVLFIAYISKRADAEVIVTTPELEPRLYEDFPDTVFRMFGHPGTGDPWERVEIHGSAVQVLEGEVR